MSDFLSALPIRNDTTPSDLLAEVSTANAASFQATVIGDVNAVVTGDVNAVVTSGDINAVVTGDVNVTSGDINATVTGSVSVTGGDINAVVTSGDINAAVTGSVSVTGGDINAVVTSGDINAVVTGDVNVSSGNINAVVTSGDINAAVTGSVSVTSGDINAAVTGSVSVTSGDINAVVTGDVNVTSGDINAVVTGDVNVTSGDINAVVTQSNAALLKASMFASDGNSITMGNPLPVVMSTATPGTEIWNFQQTNAVTANTTATHTYVVSNSKTLETYVIFACGSGKSRVQVDTTADNVTWTPRLVGFGTAANPLVTFNLQPNTGLAVGPGDLLHQIRIVIQNTDNQAQNLYSTMCGTEV